MHRRFRDAFREFGGHEGLCDVGVIALGPAGWQVVSRRRFTNWGSALSWCESEGRRIGQRHCWARLRAALVAIDNPRGETLDSVCAEYEIKRIEGDPHFTHRSQR
jgi:hypothetical protein